jgi:Rrf2 family nitric oxide-sensitive transcriptional repressor|tara:strand:+ start:532 stop:960 length:429 start_codon:yes stop_codon:yes gene_type:complete
MQMDKFTDYALRILIILAVRDPERLSTSAIAKIYDLSDNHLSKVASELVRLGFVTSVRGRAGGLTLAMPAKDISVGAVVRAIKADAPVVECFGTNKSCRILPACGLRTPMQEAQEAFFAALDPYSLQDVSQAKSSLAELLAP